MMDMVDSRARTSSNPTTTAISSNNVTEPSCNDHCCSGNNEFAEKASKDDCSGRTKKTIKDKCQETCCSGNDQVALTITGMTCTGCETKLQRVLGTLPPITKLKTSLVMARAEFNLDTVAMSPESVIKHLERTHRIQVRAHLDRQCQRLLASAASSRRH